MLSTPLHAKSCFIFFLVSETLEEPVCKSFCNGLGSSEEHGEGRENIKIRAKLYHKSFLLGTEKSSGI